MTRGTEFVIFAIVGVVGILAALFVIGLIGIPLRMIKFGRLPGASRHSEDSARVDQGSAREGPSIPGPAPEFRLPRLNAVNYVGWVLLIAAGLSLAYLTFLWKEGMDASSRQKAERNRELAAIQARTTRESNEQRVAAAAAEVERKEEHARQKALNPWLDFHDDLMTLIRAGDAVGFQALFKSAPKVERQRVLDEDLRDRSYSSECDARKEKSVLTAAVATGQTDIVRFLLETSSPSEYMRSDSPDYVDGLTVALDCRRLEIAELLLKAAESHGRPAYPLVADLALLSAAERHQAEIAGRLLRFGVPVNFERRHITALFIAVRDEDRELFDQLLPYCPSKTVFEHWNGRHWPETDEQERLLAELYKACDGKMQAWPSPY